MPSRYVHLANTDMKNKIMEILGIKKEELKNVDELQPKICWNCNEENPFSYNYCFKCGVNLKQKDVPEVDQHDENIYKKLHDIQEQLKEMQEKDKN